MDQPTFMSLIGKSASQSLFFKKKLVLGKNDAVKRLKRNAGLEMLPLWKLTLESRIKQLSSGVEWT